MLHAKDIMVGDWVILYGSFTRWGYTDYAKWHNEMERTDIHAVEPVRITPEILEKNGFKEEQLPIGIRKMIWESEDTRTEIVLYMDDTMPMEIRKNIYYEDEICYTLPFVWAVHQLQQVLRLCNIEKTIEL